MKLASLKSSSRDGELVVVKRDLSRYEPVQDITPNLQSALDNWDKVFEMLNQRYEDLNSGKIEGLKWDQDKFGAPLPRGYEWFDASTFLNHVVLVRKSRGTTPHENYRTDPLIYQGGSGTFLGPNEPLEVLDESWGLDFESEVCVVLGDTPRETKKEDASKYVRLVAIINDVSYRNLIAQELKKSFGFLQSKPPTAFAAVMVTPDELGDAWCDGRINLRMQSYLNGKQFGSVDAGEMHFSFLDLVEHITKTRPLTAGTIIGSGTISNEDQSRGSSCLAEKRVIEKLDTGTITTPYLKEGDSVKIGMVDPEGHSIFGWITQNVIHKK